MRSRASRTRRACWEVSLVVPQLSVECSMASHNRFFFDAVRSPHSRRRLQPYNIATPRTQASSTSSCAPPAQQSHTSLHAVPALPAVALGQQSLASRSSSVAWAASTPSPSSAGCREVATRYPSAAQACRCYSSLSQEIGRWTFSSLSYPHSAPFPLPPSARLGPCAASSRSPPVHSGKLKRVCKPYQSSLCHRK